MSTSPLFFFCHPLNVFCSAFLYNQNNKLEILSGQCEKLESIPGWLLALAAGVLSSLGRHTSMPYGRQRLPLPLFVCLPPRSWNCSTALIQLWPLGTRKAQSIDCFVWIKRVYGVSGFNESLWLLVLWKRLTLAIS